MTNRTITRVLVANRGEIARRIIRTLTRLGIDSVAVYSDADASAPYVSEATEAVRIGPGPASESYLRIDRIIEAACTSGAEAIHPGYGFLSESVEFARACAAAGLVFIGPGAHAIEVMGDKARSRDHVAQAGVPVVAGFTATGLTDGEVAERATQIGFPLIIKPSAGGGGKGMEIVRGPESLQSALDSARRLARSAFGDDTLILERLIERPRHIEVQVFGDTHGTVLALGERECTLQRRHQKVIEEAPSEAITSETRRRLLEAAVQAAKSVDYVGAGTVEFLVDADQPDDFFFIEMNTRLQVEHPVTELVTGLDLVEWQLLVASGGRLPADPPAMNGHAIEARVYAESPSNGFLPSVGKILMFDVPNAVRVDSAVEAGSFVPEFYDPMIAKVIAHGSTREEALTRLDAALRRSVVLGVHTNIGFLRRLLGDDRVRAGDMHTGLIEDFLPIEPAEVTAVMLDAAQALRQSSEEPRTTTLGKRSLWSTITPGWRAGSDPEPAPPAVFLTDEDEQVQARRDRVQGASQAVAARDSDGALWVCESGETLRLRPLSRRQRTLLTLDGITGGSGTAGPDCVAPMPGTVTRIHVESGTHVSAGDPILSIEAMKMEHPVLAPFDGVVTVKVAEGDQVQRDQRVARVESDGTEQ